MVALQILALSVRVRVLLSQQMRFHYEAARAAGNAATALRNLTEHDGGIAQLVRAHDS